MTTAVIPCYANTRACVAPNNTWMMPFVTPGLVTGTPTALDPSISPLKVKVEEAVCWWWRWKKLKLKIYDLDYGFGNQEFYLERNIPPTGFQEKHLAKSGSFSFEGSFYLEIDYPGPPPFTDRLYIGASVFILPPEGTAYGTEFDNGVVFQAYQIENIPAGTGIMSPSTCDCVPTVVIQITITIESGPELVNHLKNFGIADETFSADFGGEYGGSPETYINAHGITLNNSNFGTSAFTSGATKVVEIFPVEWFGWNGTWNTDTGERL